jgi:hypothetical protein
MSMPLFLSAKTAAGIDEANPEAARLAAALPKKDLLFMIIVLLCEFTKLYYQLSDGLY